MKRLAQIATLIFACSTGSDGYASGYYVDMNDSICYAIDSTFTNILYDTSIAITTNNVILVKGVKNYDKIGIISKLPELYTTIYLAKPIKGQYEKSDVYNKRLNAFKRKFKGRYIVDIDCKKEYNADDERIVINLSEFFNIKHTSKLVGIYTGQNTFGVKKKVSKYEDDYYGIYLGGPVEVTPNDPDIDNNVAYKYSTILFNGITPQAAKQMMTSLGVAYELDGIYDVETSIDDGETATIDNPYETKRVHKMLLTKIRVMFLYNKFTKQIYRKIIFK